MQIQLSSFIKSSQNFQGIPVIIVSLLIK